MARIQISNDPSGRIIVSFPYDPSIITKIKAIEGRRWHPTKKHWSLPNSKGTLDKILEVFENKEVQIDPALNTANSKKRILPRPLWERVGVRGIYPCQYEKHRKDKESVR